MKKYWVIIILLTFSGMLLSANKSFYNKSVILNLDDTDIQSFLMLMARQSGLQLEVGDGVSGNISYHFGKITPSRALNRVSKDLGLTYSVEGDTLFVSKKDAKDIVEEKDEDVDGSSTSADKFEYIKLKYVSAKELPKRIEGLLKTGEKILVDEVTNSISIFASRKSTKRINAFINNIDKVPMQIIIEAQIVEISKSKSKEFGISFGALDNAASSLAEGGSLTGISDSGFTSVPTGSLAVKMGQLASSSLQIKLRAAEANGDAKVISRPKVVTLNNLKAHIKSGITYHIKTLSGESSSDISGDVKSITAGLTLEVTPTKVGEDEIKLKIKVTNSEPDESSGVDGIPGIVENSANTTILVKSGETATMAGLVKNSFSKNRTGVPGLSDIPFFGWLFKTEAERDRDTEMMIFITPRIVKGDILAKKSEMIDPKKVPGVVPKTDIESKVLKK